MRRELQDVLTTFGGDYRFRRIGWTDEIVFSLYGDPATLESKEVVALADTVMENEFRLAVTVSATAAFGLRMTARAEQHKTLWSWDRRQKIRCEFGDPRLDARYRCRTTDVQLAGRVLADPLLRQWMAFICAKDVNVEYHAAAPGPDGVIALVIEPMRRSSPAPVHLCQAVGSVIRALRTTGLVR